VQHAAVAMISVVPTALAVTRPELLTDAMEEARLLHEKPGFAMVFPRESLATAESWVVAPMDASDTESGVTVMLAFGRAAEVVADTVTEAVPAALPSVAVIVAFPLARPVTVPSEPTDATLESLDDQATLSPDMMFPQRSRTVGVNVAEFPPASVTESGEMRTLLGVPDFPCEWNLMGEEDPF
jgi:hypothetical protein